MKQRTTTLFGPAGNPSSFYDTGYKHSHQMPAHLNAIDLDWYEYSCGRGVNLRVETATKIGDQAADHNIGMSVHAPYYINFANPDGERQIKSRNYVHQTLHIARSMQAERIIFHPGACAKMDRGDALRNAMQSIQILLDEVRNARMDDIILCPETMGKINQLGNLKEVLTLCQLDDRMIPTLDFGHLNARRQGSIRCEEDYAAILDAVENRLGNWRMRNIHIHFSHIEYTKSGEKKHLTFEDQTYGPFFEPLARQLVKRNMTAVIICESSDAMIRDAKAMKQIYQHLLR